MSERPQGEQWWLASDGRWYPPEARSGEPLPPPPSGIVGVQPRLVSKGLTYSTFGALVGTSLIYLAYTVATIGYLINYTEGGAANAGITAQSGDVTPAEDIYFIALGLAGLATMATAALFITWCHLAYRAAASRGATATSWSAGWAIGAWFIPLANLVLPKLVLREVEQMSHPAAGDPPIGDRWKRSPGDILGRIWWIFFVCAYVTSSISLVAQGFALDDSVFEWWVMVEIGAGALYVIAAALGALYVQRIGGRLNRPVTISTTPPTEHPAS